MITINHWHSPEIDLLLARCGIAPDDYQVVTKGDSYEVDVVSKVLSSGVMAERLRRFAPDYALLYERKAGDLNFIGFGPKGAD